MTNRIVSWPGRSKIQDLGMLFEKTSGLGRHFGQCFPCIIFLTFPHGVVQVKPAAGLAVSGAAPRRSGATGAVKNSRQYYRT